MLDRRIRDSPDELVLAHALEKLRAREGLTLARLRGAARSIAAPLLSLAAVRRYAGIHDIDEAEAALAVAAECVRDALHGTDQLVADAVLALGVYADAYRQHGIDQRVIADLKADLLSRRRRRALLANWVRLHQAAGSAPAEAPSDRSLRGAIEAQVLAELARQLLRREHYSLGARAVVLPNSGLAPAAGQSPGRVVVVGGAVMDATFRTKLLPQRETSSEAYGFDLSPGGERADASGRRGPARAAGIAAGRRR